MIAVVDRGGIGRDLESRTERNPRLRGTKRRVAIEREVMAARGPIRRAHARVRAGGQGLARRPASRCSTSASIDRLPAATARSVLDGYGRYGALVDAVTETEPTFRDDLLASIDVADLLTGSIQRLADRWRS